MATKKPSTKSRKATTKKRITRTRAPKKTQMSSLRLQKQTTPFLTTSVGRETLYWVVLGIVVISFTLWIMKLQADIQAIYDSIDATNSEVIDMPLEAKDSKKER